MRPIFAAIALGLLLATPSRSFAAPAPENVSSQPPRTPAKRSRRSSCRRDSSPNSSRLNRNPQADEHAFDDLGRLWVTDTLEYPFPAAEGKTAATRVKILSDSAPTATPGKSPRSPTA